MDKKETSKKQKKFSKMPSGWTEFDIYHKRLADKQLVSEILLGALAEGDEETFREVLIAHLNTVSKLKLSRDTGIGRQTLYDLMDQSKTFDPKLSTVLAIFRSLAA